MRILKQSTARDVMVFMTDSADHLTGKTGLTLTITASKAGAAFAAISPTVTERGNGWYSAALTTSHTDTLGDLALHITGAGADAADVLMVVTEDLPGRLSSAGAGDVVTKQMTESYAADGAAPTVAQALFLIQQALTEKSISGTTMTVKKLDGSTTAATCTLDSATTPTSITRAA